MGTYDPTIVAAAVGIVISGFTAGIVTIINAVAAARDRREARAARQELALVTRSTEKKADEIITRTVEIHTLADGNLSAVTARLNVALEKIAGLEKLVTTLVSAKKVADDLAVVRAPGGPRRAGDGQTTTLGQQLEANTAAVDRNTGALAPMPDKVT